MLIFCSRSSDSDGAFETPEATTPVKTVSPIDPRTQQLTSDDKGRVRKLRHDVLMMLRYNVIKAGKQA